MDDPLKIVSEKFSNDSFARSQGIVLDSLTAEEIKMHMPLSVDSLNLYDRPHGGVIYGLADAAFSVLANNADNISVALDCTITYHNSPDPGQVLHVHGHTLSVTKRVGSYLFHVYTEGSAGKTPIATMKGTAFRTGRPVAAG